jgi:chitinase/poly(3-hydroxybutyrate) depolymerase
MKKILFSLFLFVAQIAWSQANIAVPNYANASNTYDASTGNIKFYLNGVSQTLAVGRGVNGICFYGSNMFVAMDDGIGTKGILWYSNVSFASGTFTSTPAYPAMLATGQGTFSVAADAAGNVYCANNNGTITKFAKQASAPLYSAANSSTMSFWNTAQFADASGVMVDDATGTLWAVSYANNQAAACKLSTFGTAGTIKYLTGPVNFIQKPEGIAKDASGNIWLGNNNNNEVLRINNGIVTTIVAELNANNYTAKSLSSPAEVQNFAVSASGHQLGGLVYDNLYSSKMYVNDQVSGGNTFVYSFTANNSAPTFAATAMTQIYPGAGQASIIPCALLATPANPTAIGATINAGQTATLTASACAADQTYLWKLAGSTVGTNASFTTPALNANTTYTVHCVRGGTCQSAGLNVNVTMAVANTSGYPKPALVGYLHNWNDAGNGLPYIQLDNVPAAYNVINYSFGTAQAGTTDNIQLTLDPSVDANAATRTNTFIQKMNFQQNLGKKVLLSLGGAVEAGGVINVGTITKRDNFITSVTNLLKAYPFDGIDIDIESGSAATNTSTLIFNQSGMTVQTPNSPTIDNLIYALKQIMVNYRGFRGKKMLLTFAPERAHISGGFSSYSYANLESSASYLPIIEALKDSLDLVHTQLYGTGSDLGKNGIEYCAGTMANAVASTENLMLGYTLINGQGTYSGLPASKIALGFPSPCVAASPGFMTTPNIQSVVNYFRNTGPQPAAESAAACNWMATPQNQYTKISSAAVEFGGLMTWSINYDVNAGCSNNSFATTYTGLYGAFVTSANPKNFLTFSIPNQVGASVINATTNTITVSMPAGTVLSNLVPTFTLSPNSITKKVSGTAVDFSSNVQYTVLHQDNSSKTWTVIISTAACSAPANPTAASASPTTINAGQTTNLTASGCVSGNTYRWKLGTAVVSNAASFTSPTLSANTTYTAYCVNGTCESVGTNVAVTVNAVGGPASQQISISVVTPITGGGTRTDTRTFILKLPVASPACNLPVVMAFHGDGGSGAGMESSTLFSPLAETQNFIAVYPDKLLGQSYFSYRIDQPAYLNGQIDESFMQAIIDYLYTNYGINRNRVYATGHSSGAAFVYFLSAKLPNTFAAFAPVAGFPQDYSGTNFWTNLVASNTYPKIPLMHVHGTADAVSGTQFSNTNLPNPYPATPTNLNNGWLWPIFPISNKNCANAPANYTAAYYQAGNTTVDKLTMCAGGVGNKEVSMFIVRGMGHAWPNSANTGGVDGTLAIWNFMKDNQLTTFTAPTPSILPIAITIASGQATTLTASGCGTLGYLWSSGQTSASVSVSPGSTTNYTVSCKSLLSNCQNGNASSVATVTVSGGGGTTHSILSCNELSPSPSLFRVGIVSANSIKVYLNVTAAATITLNATGTNFSGTATQTFAAADPNAFMWITVSYDGGGAAGARTVTIASSVAAVATCSRTLTVYAAPIFSFTDCANGVISGTFVAGTPSSGTFTTSIAVSQAGPATIDLSEFGSPLKMSGTLNTNLSMGQTSIIVPIVYDGTGAANDMGQITLSSVQGQGLGTQAAFCYGPLYTLVASSPCPNAVQVSTASNPTYTANQVVNAASYITTSSPPAIAITTTNSNKLTYQAGKSVTLSPGFSVSSGAVFTAKIGGCTATTPHTTIYTQGRFLYDATDQQIVPVGLNYPTDYWLFSGTNEKVNEVDLSGANMVRMTWFQNAIAGASHTDADLDMMLTKFATKRIFTTLMLWDGGNGCPQNPNKLNDANGYVSWWTNPARVTLLNNHKKHIIINLVNELGFGYSYNAGNPTDVAAFTNWRNQYKIAITTIRNAGLHIPIMIDAPLCGGSLSLVNQAAAEIIAHDPDHNIIFSVHSYWAETNETSQVAIAVSNNVPVVFGEVSSKQVGADNWNTNPATGYSECYFGIDGTNSEHTPPTGFSYKNLLPILKTNNIGWFHWEWFNDSCGGRNMTTDGNYSTLSTYGNDAVNQAVYGIKNVAVKAAAGAF